MKPILVIFRVAVVVLVALMGARQLRAGDAKISETKELFESVIEKWSGLSSITFETHYESEWVPEFLEFRKSIGSPMQISYPSSEGKCVYFAKGDQFGYDLVNHWGNGALMMDEAGAWNGRYWQRLNRYPKKGAVLEISKIRKLNHEGGAHGGSPLYHAFRFLVAKPKNFEADDGWKYAATLDIVSDPKAWLSAIARAGRTVKEEILNGRSTLVFEFPSPFVGEHPSTTTLHRVWFDKEFPSFPVRVDGLNAKGRICSRFEVESFQSSGTFRFPKSFSVTNFDSETKFGNKPYLVDKYTVAEVKANMEIPDERFTFDTSTVRRVTDLATGKSVYIEK